MVTAQGRGVLHRKPGRPGPPSEDPYLRIRITRIGSGVTTSPTANSDESAQFINLRPSIPQHPHLRPNLGYPMKIDRSRK